MQEAVALKTGEVSRQYSIKDVLLRRARHDIGRLHASGVSLPDGSFPAVPNLL